MKLTSGFLCGHAFVGMLAIATLSLGEGSPGELIKPESILERFTIAKGGDALLVPIRIAGKEHQFIVDTGASRSCCAPSLLLGKLLDTTKVVTPNGEVEMQLFNPPDGSIGNLPFKLRDPVFSMDMTRLCEISGHHIEGILGMDFLEQYVLHIDCDRGELLFLKWTPTGLGESIPFGWNRTNQIEITADVAGIGKVQLMVDTGLVTAGSGILSSESVQGALHSSDFLKVGTGSAVTAGGVAKTTVYQGRRLGVGTFAIEQPVFDSANMNAIGLGFLSRFVVTIDFPKNQMYLLKGNRYPEVDRWNVSGLTIVKKDSLIIADQVDEGSPSARSGILSGDVLLRIGRRPAEKSSLTELRKELCKAGRVECSVRRNGREYGIVLDNPK